MRHKIAIAAFALIFGLVSFCTVASAAMKLDNQKVIEMANHLQAAGLDQSLLVLAIQNSDGRYDTSPSGLINLEKAGVSKEAIKAILKHGKPAVRPAASAVPADTSAASTEGYSLPNIRQGMWAISGSKIFLLQQEMVKRKGHVGVFNTLGRDMGAIWLKDKYRLVLKGENSRTRIPLSDVGGMFFILRGSTPELLNELELVEMVDWKGNRVVGTKKIGVFSDLGADAKNSAIPFQQEQQSNGDVKITLGKTLEPGHYCFTVMRQAVSFDVTADTQQSASIR